jgi:hypothetical protein
MDIDKLAGIAACTWAPACCSGAGTTGDAHEEDGSGMPIGVVDEWSILWPDSTARYFWWQAAHSTGPAPRSAWHPRQESWNARLGGEAPGSGPWQSRQASTAEPCS